MNHQHVKRGIFLTLLIVTGSMAVFLATTGYSEELDAERITPEDKDQYAVYSVDIPPEVYFAGEPVPLDLFDVREALDRELLSNTYFHSQTIRLIKLANRFFPQIEPILKNNDIPDDFKYLAVAESGLSQLVSPAHAVGFWQLLEGTAREYGLEVNQEVDERYHISKATEVACKYFRESYEKYGNWTMTAASYNAGRRGVDRQMERQKTENYYDLLLNEETARYLFRVIAFKLIFQNPSEYGFNISKKDLYPVIPTWEIVINGPVEDFADFAASHDTNYKILKYLNPWLREKSLRNSSGKSYIITLPETGYRRPRAWDY